MNGGECHPSHYIVILNNPPRNQCAGDHHHPGIYAEYGLHSAHDIVGNVFHKYGPDNDTGGVIVQTHEKIGCCRQINGRQKRRDETHDACNRITDQK